MTVDGERAGDVAAGAAARRRRPRRADDRPASQAGAASATGGADRAAPEPGRAEEPSPGLLPSRAAEDTGRAWGEWRDDDDSNDDRLLRDKPPHWG